MKFSLGNGKVVNVPAAFFFEMNDSEFEKELENLLSLDLGFECNDIWEDSVLRDGEIKKKKVIPEDETLPLLDDDVDMFFENDD